jgi:hypothetical protein
VFMSTIHSEISAIAPAGKECDAPRSRANRGPIDEPVDSVPVLVTDVVTNVLGDDLGRNIHRRRARSGHTSSDVLSKVAHETQERPLVPPMDIEDARNIREVGDIDDSERSLRKEPTDARRVASDVGVRSTSAIAVAMLVAP